MAEPCKNCLCECVPVSSECIVSLSELPSWNVVKPNHISNATDDVDDLIGLNCSEELCSQLSKAIEEVNNSGGVVADYLPKIWLNIIENKHFKKWYANRVAWHWFEGASISELKSVGLVVPANNDEQFRNGFQMAEEKERKRLQAAAANYASGARLKFLQVFWACNICDYECRPKCECNLSNCLSCNPEGVGGRGLSVGFEVV